MRTTSEQAAGRIDVALGRSSRISGLSGVLLFLALLHNPSQALSAIVPPSYSVTLGWQISPDPSVTGYRLYYGPASGNYTNSVVVGNVTTNTVSGLASGVTYFFSVTALNASGLESPFSNEINFVPGVPMTWIQVMATGQTALTGSGLISHIYDVQATQDLKTWTVIGTATAGAGGWLKFTDANAANFPRRFYRTRDTQP